MDIVEYVHNEFSPPEWWWSRAHTEIRVAEMRAAYTALSKCMELLNPNSGEYYGIYLEPEDLLYDYIYELERMADKCKNPANISMYNSMKNAVEKIRNWFIDSKTYYKSNNYEKNEEYYKMYKY